jgi:LPPG:FO 2-phospho-L-lactate transferase
VVALAGGVGAARFLRGLVRAVDPAQVVVIVNTGDDRTFYGVHVSPDVDIVTYTLADRVDPEKGYGLAGDTFAVVDALARLGHETWFRLGDRDLAHCLHRTLRLREGSGLTAVCDEIRRAFGISTRILPMTEDPAPTYIDLAGNRRVHFEEYLARDGAPDEVTGVDLSARHPSLPQQPGGIHRTHSRRHRHPRGHRRSGRPGGRRVAHRRRRAVEGTGGPTAARHRGRGLGAGRRGPLSGPRGWIRDR